MALWLACLILAGGWIWQALEIEHDLQAFLPLGERPVEALLMAEATSGAASRLVFVAFEGGALEDRLQASRDAASTLRSLEGVTRVANGADGVDTDAFERLFPYRFVLADPPSFDPESLRTALDARLRELRSPLGAAVEARLESDPTASFRTLLRRFGETTTAPRLEDGVWVTDDRARSLILATIEEAGGDLSREAVVIGAMTAALDGIAKTHGVDLLMAGRPALAAEARDSIRQSFVIGSMVASALVISLLLWLFRSAGVLVLGILPLASGVLAGLAAVLALFGAVHGIALAFGVTLLGIAIDYPLHLFSHHRAGDSLSATACAIQRPLCLGAFTTASAFLIFGLGSTPGLGQLACFTGVGIAVAALVLRYPVPVLAERLGIEPKPRHVNPLPDRAPAILIPAAGALAVAAALWLGANHADLFETDVAHLNPLPDQAKQLDRKLRGDIGAPDLRRLFLIEADDAETVLGQCETALLQLEVIVGEGGLAGVDAPCRYLPSQVRQRDRQATLPSADELDRALDEASADLPFKRGLFAPFLEAVEQSRTLPPLDAEAGLALFAETPFGDRLTQLLIPFEGHWYGLVPLIGESDPTQLEALASEMSHVEVIDLKAMSEGLLIDVRNEALQLLACAILAALALLGLLRHPLSSLARSLAVLVLSLLVTAALLTLVGERLTMLHVLAALLVVGLGIDYTVFFAWPSADARQRRRTRQALIACVLSTVIVFGLLASSSIGVLRAIGLTVAIGACTTFAASYVMFSRQQT